MRCSNKQVGPTCGFYAMAFVWAKICGRKKWGKKAYYAVRDAIENKRTEIGEIFSLEGLQKEWNSNFATEVSPYGYITKVVDISSEKDIEEAVTETSYLILPVAPTKGGTPHFIVVHRKSNGRRDVWDSNDKRSVYCKAHTELYEMHANVLEGTYCFGDYYNRRCLIIHIRNIFRCSCMYRYLERIITTKRERLMGKVAPVKLHGVALCVKQINLSSV